MELRKENYHIKTNGLERNIKEQQNNLINNEKVTND